MARIDTGCTKEEQPVVLKKLPSVERILSNQLIRGFAEKYSHKWVADLVREQINEARSTIREGHAPPNEEDIAFSTAAKITAMGRVSPRRVINATGVILHTNLGRAPLSADAARTVCEVSQGYTDLELDVSEGKRGLRGGHVEKLLCQLTGAEAALVVNNNASSLLLAFSCLLRDKDVLVSRGEIVEIGGGFRIPDVLTQSGATLIEVGTTNRTYVGDYDAAVTENTGAILKVHSSNFRIAGFAHSPGIEELVSMGGRYGIPVFHDIGSGCLLNMEDVGLEHEPTPQENISSGVGLVFFSGDKLLGGPQAGIIVGRKEYIERLRKHPIARAVRADKLSLAALGSTLLHYVKGEAATHIPIWRMINADLDHLKNLATTWAKAVGARGSVIQGYSTFGGGSLPIQTLETWLLVLACEGIEGGAATLSRRLRENDPPVISRILDGNVVLDPRTVSDEEDGLLIEAIKGSFRSTFESLT